MKWAMTIDWFFSFCTPSLKSLCGNIYHTHLQPCILFAPVEKLYWWRICQISLVPHEVSNDTRLILFFSFPSPKSLCGNVDHTHLQPCILFAPVEKLYWWRIHQISLVLHEVITSSNDNRLILFLLYSKSQITVWQYIMMVFIHVF